MICNHRGTRYRIDGVSEHSEKMRLMFWRMAADGVVLLIEEG